MGPFDAVGQLLVGRDAAQISIGVVVGVENRHLGHARLAVSCRQVVEEPGLGLLVGFQAAVDVQVLVGDVGDGGHVEITGSHAVLR